MAIERSSIVSSFTRRKEKDCTFFLRTSRTKITLKDSNGPNTEKQKEIYTASAMCQALVVTKELKDSTLQIGISMQLSINPGSSNP